MLALGDNDGHSVGSFLSAKDLAAAEQAGIFDPLSLGSLWHCLAASALSTLAPWGAASRKLLQSVPMHGSALEDVPGKQVLRDMGELRRSFVPPSAAWAPWISAPSPSSLQATPCPAVVDTYEFQQEGGALRRHFAVALRFGAYRGSPLAAGVRLTSEGGRIHKGCCFGLELAGSRDGWGRFMSYTFAPTTGRCFQQFGEAGEALCADGLPAIKSAAGTREPELEEVVDAWVKVTPEGDISFMRQVPGGPLEATGLMPHTALPNFVEEYHATVHFHGEALEVPVSASVIHSGADLPPALLAQAQRPAPEFSAVWHLGEEEEEEPREGAAEAEERREE